MARIEYCSSERDIIIIINLINQHIYELGWVCVMGALI